MNYDTPCMTDIEDLGALDSSESWVREVLEPDQLTESKMSYAARTEPGNARPVLGIARLRGLHDRHHRPRRLEYASCDGMSQSFYGAGAGIPQSSLKARR